MATGQTWRPGRAWANWTTWLSAWAAQRAEEGEKGCGTRIWQLAEALFFGSRAGHAANQLRAVRCKAGDDNNGRRCVVPRHSGVKPRQRVGADLEPSADPTRGRRPRVAPWQQQQQQLHSGGVEEPDDRSISASVSAYGAGTWAHWLI